MNCLVLTLLTAENRWRGGDTLLMIENGPPKPRFNSQLVK